MKNDSIGHFDPGSQAGYMPGRLHEGRQTDCLLRGAAGARGKDVKTETMKKREEPAPKPAWYSTG